MGKKSRLRNKTAKPDRMPFVARTFEGLPAEADWIALREFVPAAVAPVKLNDGRMIRVCSLLPGTGAGLVRPDGQIWLGLQVVHNFGDISRDLAHVVQTALESEPGTPVAMSDPGVGERLQDLVDPASSFDVEVHDGFDFWVEDTDPSPETIELLAQANESVDPTARLKSVDGAYWTEMGSHRYLRWVMTHEDVSLLDALARLRADGADGLGDDTALLGHFRAHGRLVPVWEPPPPSTGPADLESLEEHAVAFAGRLEEALADDRPLTSAQRSARSSLTSRQVAIR